MLTSPALELARVALRIVGHAGGILMMLYALDAARRPHGPDHRHLIIADVRE